MNKASTLTRRAALKLLTAAAAGVPNFLGAVPTNGEIEIPGTVPPVNYYNAPQEAVDAWRQWKFGFLMQWNMSSLRGGEIGWSRGGRRWGLEWSGTGSVPVEEYDNLYKQFKAEKFNARELCETIKSSGMQYAAFCHKHHDGFCMWDTKLTDYKITNPACPVGRDLAKEWAEACRATRLKQVLYFSQPDWHHPDYLRSPESHARYQNTMHGWVRELCTNYGTIDGIFFDGLGGIATNWDSETLFRMIRTLQPNTLINSRCGAYDVKGWPINRWLQPGEDQKEHLEMSHGLAGDYDTPEQRIGRMQMDRPWETVTSIQKDQWSYKEGQPIYSLQEILQTLIHVAGRDGNLMLSAAMLPDGSIESRQLEILRGCGDWLRKYGTSIYGTRGGPYYPTSFGVTTCRDNKVFVHITDWPEEVLSLPSFPTTLTLPAIHRKLVSGSLLTGGVTEVKQDAQGAVLIRVAKEHRQAIDTIVVLELDGPASDAKPGLLPGTSVKTAKKVRASNVYSGLSCFKPENAVDDDSHTRWATDFGIKKALLEVDLGKEQSISSVLIQEDLGFVRKFTVDIKRGDLWIPVVEGETIGEEYRKTFDPVNARYVRLNILDAIAAPQFPVILAGGHSHMIAYPGPTIWTFQVS